MYTKENLKYDMLKFIKMNGYNAEKIGAEASRIFSLKMNEYDDEVYQLLIDIFTMEEGPEFHMTKDEFMKFLNNM